jgi:hypothetical protein
MRGRRLSTTMYDMTRTKHIPRQGAVTVRRARPDDAAVLARLAALDSSPVPGGTVLIGEIAGEPLAAVSADDFSAVADPFAPTGDLVLLLTERARQLRRGEARRRRGRRAVLRWA